LLLNCDSLSTMITEMKKTLILFKVGKTVSYFYRDIHAWHLSIMYYYLQRTLTPQQVFENLVECGFSSEKFSQAKIRGDNIKYTINRFGLSLYSLPMYSLRTWSNCICYTTWDIVSMYIFLRLLISRIISFFYYFFSLLLLLYPLCLYQINHCLVVISDTFLVLISGW
jgi:hypothetical protein